MPDDPTDKPAQDTVIPLSRFRVELGRPSARKRVDALLDARDPAAAIAALAVPDFFFLVRDLGFDESRDLLVHSTPEQIRGCLDLECWDRDRAVTAPALGWLSALADIGYEKLTEAWAGLDPEFAALLLRRHTEIYDLSLGDAPPDEEERPIFTTPDTFFAVVLTAESDDEIRMVHQLLDHLYRGDQALARYSILAARSEMDSELEEMSQRWRAGRMADLGYADFYEALEVYRPLDAGQVKIGEGSAEGGRSPEPDEGRIGQLPVPMAASMGGRGFLARALEQVTDAAEAARLQSALLYLVNRVLSAARVSPGDEEAVRIGTEHATATLALGLAQVAAGNLTQAVAALGSISLTRLHRVGYSVTLKLARLAARLAPRAATAGEPTDAVLAALLGRRPFYAAELDGGEGRSAFDSMADVRRVAEHLAELTARIALAEALGVDLLTIGQAPEAPSGFQPRPGEPEPRAELDDHARTALVRNLGGGPFDAAPLSAEELDSFLGAAFEDGELTEAARTRAAGGLVALLDQAQITAGREVYPALLSRWLDELADGFGGLESGEPLDPRGIAGVITSLGKA
jgi:hypothetical protein